MTQTQYNRMERVMKDALGDLAILAGDTIPINSDATWQDVAGTAAVNLRVLATLIEDVRHGTEPYPTFPSPVELLDIHFI